MREEGSHRDGRVDQLIGDDGRAAVDQPPRGPHRQGIIHADGADEAIAVHDEDGRVQSRAHDLARRARQGADDLDVMSVAVRPEPVGTATRGRKAQDGVGDILAEEDFGGCSLDWGRAFVSEGECVRWCCAELCCGLGLGG